MKKWLADSEISLSDSALNKIMDKIKSVKVRRSSGFGRRFSVECLDYCDLLSQKHTGMFPDAKTWEEEDKEALQSWETRERTRGKRKIPARGNEEPAEQEPVEAGQSAEQEPVESGQPSGKSAESENSPDIIEEIEFGYDYDTPGCDPAEANAISELLEEQRLLRRTQERLGVQVCQQPVDCIGERVRDKPLEERVKIWLEHAAEEREARLALETEHAQRMPERKAEGDIPPPNPCP